jgi:hypothetical protein
MSDADSTAPENKRDGRLTSYGLAVLVVDGLYIAGIVTKEQLDRAIAIAAEEIEVRKCMGDY